MRSIGNLVTQACLLEALAPKLGNVHPTASFADMSFSDFETSARVIGPVFEEWESRSLGWLIEESVRRTREAVGINTNLGMVLLLGPLVKALAPMMNRSTSLNSLTPDSIEASLQRVIQQSDHQDSMAIYRAIAMAKPGGLGSSDELDIVQSAPKSIVTAMQMAQDRDSIAAEYCNRFRLCREVSEKLLTWRRESMNWESAICRIQLELLAACGDSLVTRKLGQDVNREIIRLATEAHQALLRDERTARDLIDGLDRYLRADGHRRNPGTTADLIAGGIFIALVRLELEETNHE